MAGVHIKYHAIHQQQSCDDTQFAITAYRHCQGSARLTHFLIDYMACNFSSIFLLSSQNFAELLTLFLHEVANIG